MNQFHVDNVKGSIGTTVLGLGYLAQTVGQQIAATGLPSNAAGWVGFAANVAVGIAAIFARA